MTAINHGWNDIHYLNSLDKIQYNKKGFSFSKLTTLPLIKPHWVDLLVSWSQILTGVRYKLTGELDTTYAPIILQQDKDRCKCYYHHLIYEAHLVAFVAVYGFIDSLCKPIQVIDLTSLIGFSKYFLDHLYLTDEGAYVIA